MLVVGILPKKLERHWFGVKSWSGPPIKDGHIITILNKVCPHKIKTKSWTESLGGKLMFYGTVFVQNGSALVIFLEHFLAMCTPKVYTLKIWHVHIFPLAQSKFAWTRWVFVVYLFICGFGCLENMIGWLLRLQAESKAWYLFNPQTVFVQKELFK